MTISPTLDSLVLSSGAETATYPLSGLTVFYSVSPTPFRSISLLPFLLLCALSTLCLFLTLQLEAREGAGSVSGGVQSAAGPGAEAAQGVRGQYGETATLRREREEQRRLLADTHSTAMDLRCRLEHNERDWSREKAELLERFDVERSEWESQLKDMQRKIEEVSVLSG